MAGKHAVQEGQSNGSLMRESPPGHFRNRSAGATALGKAVSGEECYQAAPVAADRSNVHASVRKVLHNVRELAPSEFSDDTCWALIDCLAK